MKKLSENLDAEAAKKSGQRFGILHACVYLVAITLMCYYPALGSGRTFLPADLTMLIPPWSHHSAEIDPSWHTVTRPIWDPLFQFYPARKFLAQAIHLGFVPWHDPYVFSGSPFIADGQSAFFYPVNWLFAVLPLASAFGIVAALHTFLTGLFFVMFTRRKGLGWEASLVGATTWMLCGTLVAWQMWQVVDSTLCWLPLCLYCAERICSERTTSGKLRTTKCYWNNSAGLAAGMGLMLVAGHEQFALYGIVIVIAYMLVKSYQALSIRIGLVLGIVAVSGLIASSQILPTISLLHDSLRGQNTIGDLLTTAMPWNHLALLFMPEILGGYRDWQTHGYIGSVNYTELCCYVGVASAALASFAFYQPSAGKKRELIMWFCIAIIGLLIGLGTPVYNILFYAFPIVKSFHGVARTIVLTEFSIAILASYGMQVAVESSSSADVKSYFGKCTGLIGLLAVALYGIVASRTPEVVAYQLTHDWLTYGLGQLGRALILLLLVWIAVVIVSPNLRWLAVVVVAADMLTFASGLNPGSDSSTLYGKLPAVDAMIQTAGGGRVVCLGGGRPLDRIIPNSAESIGLSDVSGSDPLLLANYSDFIHKMNTDQTGNPAPDGEGIVGAGGNIGLDLLNVKAVVSPQPITVPGYELTYNGSDVYVYANSRAKGEVWTEAPTNLLAFNDNAARGLNDNTSVSSLPLSSVKLPEEISTTLSTGGHEAIVFSEIADSAWKVTVDGKPQRWQIADGLFVRVPLDSGKHDITLSYLPQAGFVGIYLSGIGWMIVVWVVTTQILIRRKAL